jgi:hypothetical protein
LESLRGSGESHRDAIGDAGDTDDRFLGLLQYHDDVIALLRDVLEDEAALIVAMDRYITFDSGLLRNFVDDVNAADFRVVVTEYQRYYADVREELIDTEIDLSQEQLSVLIDILILSSLYN